MRIHLLLIYVGVMNLAAWTASLLAFAAPTPDDKPAPEAKRTDITNGKTKTMPRAKSETSKAAKDASDGDDAEDEGLFIRGGQQR